MLQQTAALQPQTYAAPVAGAAQPPQAANPVQANPAQSAPRPATYPRDMNTYGSGYKPLYAPRYPAETAPR